MTTGSTSSWLTATTIDGMAPYRDVIVNSHAGGTTVDFETIGEEIAIGDQETDASILQRWFDFCMERWRAMFARGPLVIYRAIGVDDVAATVATIRRGDDMGCHWTWDAASASTGYHGGKWKPIDLMMTGVIEEVDVEWATTLQLHFGHPHEREIRAKGAVVVTGLVRMDTGETIEISPPLPRAA